jgi:hypothetical protein
MMLVSLTLLITINQYFVLSITFDPKFVPKIIDNLASSITKGGTFDPKVFPDMLINLPEDQLSQNIDKIIKSGQSAELKEALRHVPLDKALKPAIQIGDMSTLEALLSKVSNADLSSYIFAAAARQRPDMVVALAKHGNQYSLYNAFIVICTKLKNPRAFLAMLLKETKHHPGSNGVQVHIYDAIMKGLGDPRQKFQMIHAFISSSDNAQTKKSLVEALSLSDKKMLLVYRAEKLDKETVRLLAESRDDIPFDEALEYFAKYGSWDFIETLFVHRPQAVTDVILKYLPKQNRADVLKNLLANMEPSNALIPVFKSVAKSGDLDILPLVLDKVKNQIEVAGPLLKNQLSNFYKKDPRFFSPLFESHPVPKDWVLLDGIRYASSARQDTMVQTLLSQLDNVAVAKNLPLKYAVLYRDMNLIQILLQNQKVLAEGLDDTMMMVDRLLTLGKNRNVLFEIYRKLEVAKYTPILL